METGRTASPTHCSDCTALLSLHTSQDASLGPSTKGLNEDQVAAISAIRRGKDYTLVLGMPGTGKTSTIVAAIQALLSAHKTVLVTAYTHSAVDNIVLKLIAQGVGVVRVPGSHPGAVHPGVRDYIPGGAR